MIIYLKDILRKYPHYSFQIIPEIIKYLEENDIEENDDENLKVKIFIFLILKKKIRFQLFGY